MTITTRRMVSAAVLGGIAGVVPWRTGRAQPPPPGGELPSAAPAGPPRRAGSLPDRGAPTGRIGAATRGDQPGGLALDLVAPSRGVGLTGVDQPTLFFLLSDAASRPMRLTVSTRGQARPLADLELPRAQPAGLGMVRLRERGVRLPPEVAQVWSVSVLIDPRAPSRDLVASAAILHRPIDPALERAVRAAPPERGAAMLAEAGYWYDAVALAEQHRSLDRGAALAALLEREGLRMPGAAVARAGAAR